MDITPDNQNVESLFSTKVYEIDFYQRQYKWNREPVEELLRDIFYKFDSEYQKYGASDIPIDENISKYAWYYLNTYVTTTIDGRTYVVDGQQRLTTLTLILIKLNFLCRKIDEGLHGWIERKICGQSGRVTRFWMNHKDSQRTLENIYLHGTDAELAEKTVTAQNLIANYRIISEWIDDKLPLDDAKRFEAFVYYFINRLVLVKLDVTNNDDVPMVFEVINDRGVKLRPYEIIKGKLLGQIPKDELDSLGFNAIWEDGIGKLNSIRENEADAFFRTYLRAKFVDTVSDRQKFDGEYHRPMMAVEELHLEHDPKGVKKFLKEDFCYYANLYARLNELSGEENEDCPSVFYNDILRLDSQMTLILSACSYNDPDEAAKIKIVSEQLERMYCLLQLQSCYDSNEFARGLVDVMRGIRNAPVEVIPEEFDKCLAKMIQEKKGVEKIDSVWSYAYFKNAGLETLNKAFIRYVLARIEKLLSEGANVRIRHSIRDLATKKYQKGFHVEHILARNDENKNKFDNNDELFEQQRNRLGDLLLLKGPDNESSGKEPYQEKLKTYVGSLLWNETLVEATYKSNLDLRNWISKNQLSMRPLATFGAKEIEERQVLLFELFAKVWNVEK